MIANIFLFLVLWTFVELAVSPVLLFCCFSISFNRVSQILLIHVTYIYFQILSRDSVTVAVDAVVYFRISNATISVTNVEDASRSTKLLAQTTLRNILGTKTLAEMLSDREAISMQMQVMFSEHAQRN